MTNSFIEQEIANLPPEVSEKIDRLTNLQIRMMVAKIFAELDKSGVGADESNPLRWELRYWSSEDSKDYTVEHVRENMRNAYNAFGRRDSLQEYSEFANNIATLMQGESRKDCAVIMRRFCNCLSLVRLKSEEQQQIFFESFPPSGEYLKCSAGTDERLEQLERELSSKEEYLPFLNAHNFVISNCVESIKEHVDEEYHIHIQKYLEHSLGLRAKEDIFGFAHLQSQIPFWKLSAVNRDYPADFFKFFLSREIAKAIDVRRAEIGEAVSDLRSMFSGVYDLNSFDPSSLTSGEEEVGTRKRKRTFLYQDINAKLQRFEKNGVGFIVDNGDGGNASLDLNLLDQASSNIPPLKFLDMLLESKKFRALSEEIPTAEKTESLLRLESDIDNFFTERAAGDLLTLLRVEDGRPINHRELFFGLENLWMAGEAVASNLPIQFYVVVGMILAERPNYFDEIKPEIEMFLPHQLEKIESIKANYLALSSDQDFIRMSASSNLWRLFFYNAPIEKIEESVNSFEDVDSLNKALVDGFLLRGQTVIDNYSICEKLVQRPDCDKILQNIRQKFGQEIISSTFTKICLEAAANNNNEYLCKYLLEHFVPNTGDHLSFRGSKLFHHFARHNNLELTEIFSRYLIDHGIPQYCGQVIGNESPIEVAAIYGNVGFIRKMVELFGPQQSGVNLSDNEGRGLQHIAAEHGRTSVLLALDSWRDNLLREDPVDLFRADYALNTSLHYAAFEGHVEALRGIKKIYEKRGANFGDVVKMLNSRNAQGCTPLHLAASNGKSNAIKFLCDFGADSRVTDNSGDDALSLALDRYDVASVRELKDAKDDLDRLDSQGRTLIYRLAEKGDLDRIKTLIQAGADINCRNQSEFRDTPIHLAIKNNKPGLIPILCGFGADPNLENSYKISPLTLALSHHKIEAVKELRVAGVDLERRLREEAYEGNRDFARILVEAGADVNAQYKKGCGTTLNNIVNLGIHNPNKRNMAALLILMDLGIDASVRDEKGYSADYLIIREGLTSAVRKVPIERIDPLICEAIDRGDEKTLNQIIFFSKNKTIAEDVIGNNCAAYLERAASLKGSEEIGSEEIIDSLRRNYPASQIVDSKTEQKFCEESKESGTNRSESELPPSSPTQVSVSPPAPPSSEVVISSSTVRVSGAANQNTQQKDS